MAFRRQVLSLTELILKYIATSGKNVDIIISENSIERLHQVCGPHKSQTHLVKQQIIHALLKNGRMDDKTIATCFFHASMKSLEFCGAKISTPFVDKFSAVCVNLEKIDLSGCFRLTDEAICILLRNCSELQSINLENCRKLTDITLSHLIERSPKLRIIHLGGNFNMTVAGITKFVERHPNHSRFHELHISGHRISEMTLKVIMSKCRKLRSLSVGYTALSDDAIIAFLRKRQSISQLSVHWNFTVTDKLLQFIAADCPNMMSLNFCGIKTFSNKAMLSMIDSKMESKSNADTNEDSKPSRKKLKTIDFRYTSISKEMAAKVKERYPELEIVF